jgi:hypothetical protein
MHECNAYFCFLSISSLKSYDVTLGYKGGDLSVGGGVLAYLEGSK